MKINWDGQSFGQKSLEQRLTKAKLGKRQKPVLSLRWIKPQQ